MSMCIMSQDDFFTVDLGRDQDNEELRDVIRHFRCTFHDMYTVGDMSFQNFDLYYCKPMQDDICKFFYIWSDHHSYLWDFNTSLRKCFAYHEPYYEQSGIVDSREIMLYLDLVNRCSKGLHVRIALLRALHYADRVANGEIEFSTTWIRSIRDVWEKGLEQ